MSFGDVDNTEEFRLLSLCSGYAGLELGLRGIIPALRTVAYVEVEAFAVANLVSKMEAGLLDVAPVWTDIKTFNGWHFRGNIHIITAGYPCQPFSVAGKRKGTDDPRHLWPHIERIIEAVRPVWFFGENVSGHLAIGFTEVYRSLRNLGYAVEAGLFTAAECGAPHRRERLFILAKSCRATSGNQDRQIKRRAGQANVSQGNGQIGTIRLGATSELAESSHKGLQGSIQNIETQRREDEGRFIARCRWPTRPGQHQYEWEEPRVVGYATRKRLPKRARGQMGRCGEQKQKPERPSGTAKNGQAQPRLGRAVNGTSCRVDRLRLLGNGVVPQQAEKAFRELIKLCM